MSAATSKHNLVVGTGGCSGNQVDKKNGEDCSFRSQTISRCTRVEFISAPLWCVVRIYLKRDFYGTILDSDVATSSSACCTNLLPDRRTRLIGRVNCGCPAQQTAVKEETIHHNTGIRT